MRERPEIILYTDGASRGNPGPGGYGVVISCGDYEKEFSGGFARTTNNRMELMAVIVGLEAIRWENARVNVFSDSTYVVNAVTQGWIQNKQALHHILYNGRLCQIGTYRHLCTK